MDFGKNKNKIDLFKKRLDLKRINPKRLNEILGIGKKNKQLAIGISFVTFLLISSSIVASKKFTDFPKHSKKDVLKAEVNSIIPSPSTTPSLQPTRIPEEDKNVVSEISPYIQTEDEERETEDENKKKVDEKEVKIVNLPSQVPSSIIDSVNEVLKPVFLEVNSDL